MKWNTYKLELRPKLINGILKDNDVIYLGDFKSHDIVKQGCIKHINTSFNNLKFSKLK
jgi:hypothetical protein